MASQWREGFSGPYALDMTPFLLRMQILGWSPQDCTEMLADLRAIEVAAKEARQAGRKA